ncbi:hypothetical protein RCL1_004839 [Eukaryota sp. TZLM3-RCL]
MFPSDLSARTSLFRSKLIEEFRLCDGGAAGAEVPLLSSRDMFTDTDAYNRLLRDHPLHVIKFKNFKRRPNTLDKRMTRVRHMTKVPIGVWASWLVHHRFFLDFILVIIVLNGLALFLSSELNAAENYKLIEFLHYFELFSLLIFYSEIFLKWLDSFRKFWTDGWNIFDLAVTVLSTIPEVFAFVSNDDDYHLVRLMNLLRLFKTLRILKAIVRFRNLRIIVNTVFKASAALGSLSLLLAVFIFMYAIVGIYLFENYTNSPIPRRYQYKFTSLHNALLAVFQIFTFDQWFHVMNDVMLDVHPVIVIMYWLSWIWLGSFIIRNVIIGLIVKTFEDMKKKAVKEERLNKERSSLFKDFEMVVDGAGVEKANDMPMTFSPVKPTKKEPPKNSFVDLKDLYISAPGRKPAVDENLISNLEQSVLNRTIDTIWPRDLLFDYFQLMQRFTENLQETNELVTLFNIAVLNLHES